MGGIANVRVGSIATKKISANSDQCPLCPKSDRWPCSATHDANCYSKPTIRFGSVRSPFGEICPSMNVVYCDNRLRRPATFMRTPPIDPMTLANMRSLGVNSLSVWCAGRDCWHQTTLDVAGFPDAATVPSFASRLRCAACGHLGAEVMPNWNARTAAVPISRASG